MPGRGKPAALLQKFFRILIVFSCFSSAESLQQPFARHFEHRAAGHWSDCFLGSEVCCREPLFRDLLSHGDPLQFHPWGEALNPGPSDDPGLFWVGFSNPSGLRGKEDTALSLGCGVWSFSETQLSAVTQLSCSKRLKYLAAEQHRNLRVILGAPVACRANSNWAGSWAGVATMADVPSREVKLPYTFEHNCGRMLASQHFVHGCTFLNAVVYGWPSGPTWPQAKTLNEQLLQLVTTEIVLGGHGPRLVGGDYNVSATGLDIFSYWRRLGWRSAQEFAELAWGQQVQFTCKGVTERDLIWMSPEAQAICKAVDVATFFAEHSTISVGLHCHCPVPPTLTWPLPSKIPWTQVSSDWADQATPPVWNTTGTADQQWAQWGCSFECSLTGHVLGQPNQKLQKAQTGRMQRTQPLLTVKGPSVLKPSRPSEVLMRNDLIGKDVRVWFRQLRRLQSYLASVNAGKQTVDAVQYRLELWSSIRQSPGFVGGFSHWWQHSRAYALPDSPPCVPSAPPGPIIALSLFETFKFCYEKFESWHLRKRCQLLANKYEKGMQGLYQELAKPSQDKLDFLVQNREVEVLAVSDDRLQMHLAADLSEDPDCSLTCNGEHLPKHVRERDLLTFEQPVDFQAGDALTSSQVITELPLLHSMLLDFWQPVWNPNQVVDLDKWTRLTGFIDTHVPRLEIIAPPISLRQWKQVLRKFKATAARGVDGFHPQDLLQMPDSWSLRLLDLLSQIETGQMEWPTAVLYGVVMVLAKEATACTVERYRPVVVFSAIYRAWSSLRARQLLRQLKPYMDSTAFGFVPNCETSQLWMALQGAIETTLQDGSDFCGLSTDLVRAFNHIPREASFYLASRIGVPANILRPWKSFLDNCTRAFSVRGCLSSATKSTAGMPEGDALSVYAMVQLSLVFHTYMRLLIPSVTAYSYVDNLTLTALHPFLLGLGLAGLEEFFSLWGMSIDKAKSYCWTTQPKFRSLLKILGLTREDAMTELGGVLSFSTRQYTGLPIRRLAKLESLWTRLKVSRAPLAQKLLCLQTKFWASALYGAHAAGLGEQHVDKLRAQAMKALKLQKAGVNGRVRLSLSRFPTADPGFWRLRQAFLNFRRIARKEPQFLGLWKLFAHRFNGKLFSGPFSQLFVLGSQIGWSFQPPWFCDHDGLQHSLLHLDDAALADLLLDGWYQYLARSVVHRHTMQDLVGLDLNILRSQMRSLTALEESLLGSLHSGAFMSGAQQSKFDFSKDANCCICHARDDQEHWLTCPRFEPQRQSIEDWQNRHQCDTQALRSHLLPSRSPWYSQWKAALVQIQDCTHVFESEPGDGIQHVFTDGSVCGGGGAFPMAGWGCVNATTGLVIAAGHVVGLTQSSDRAELSGALAALRWTLHFHANTHLWVDAQTVAWGLAQVLQHGVAEHWTNQDLWLEISELLDQMDPEQFHVHWNPSHLDAACLECPYEDWIRRWNNCADDLAGTFNLQRPPSFLELRQRALAHHLEMQNRSAQLMKFYFKVAGCETSSSSTEPTERSERQQDREASFDFVEDDHPSVQLLYSSDWDHLIAVSSWKHSFIPPDFVVSLCKWIISHSGDDLPVYPLSFIELAFLLAKEPGFLFPFQSPGTGGAEMSTLCRRFVRPTLSYLVKVVRDSLIPFLVGLDLEDLLFSQRNKVSLGIFTPASGVFARLTAVTITAGQSLVQEFTSNRPIRRSCDVARPV